MVYLTLFLSMFFAMLVRDALWSCATSFISKDRWLKAASVNSLGDGSGFIIQYLIAYIAIRSSGPMTVAQGAGEVCGAFVGLLAGKMLSLVLDHKLTWWSTKELFKW